MSLDLVFNLVVVISGCVYVVSEIKGATGILRNSIQNLSAAIAKLDSTVEKIEDNQNDHEVRITRLEDAVKI